MAALVVRRGKTYLVQSLRVGGRVTSRCIATGERAIQLAKDLPTPAPRGRDQTDARPVREARAPLRARRQDEDLQARVGRLADETKAMADEAMRLAGYHKHRWAWRKKRGRDVAIDRAELERAIVERVIGPTDPAEVARHVGLLAASDSTRPEGTPSGIKIMRKVHASDAGREVSELLISKWTDDAMGRELLRQQVQEMKLDLLGEKPSAIERLLVDRVATCWLGLQVAERVAINLSGSAIFSAAEKGFYDKARDRAHRRYLETLRSLSLVRTRALPAMRLSLAVQGGAAAAYLEAGAPEHPASGGTGRPRRP